MGSEGAASDAAGSSAGAVLSTGASVVGFSSRVTDAGVLEAVGS